MSVPCTIPVYLHFCCWLSYTCLPLLMASHLTKKRPLGAHWSPNLNLSLSFSIYRPLKVSLSLSLSHSLSLSLPLSLTPSVYLSLSLSLTPSVYLSLSLFPSISLSLLVKKLSVPLTSIGFSSPGEEAH